MSSTIPTAPPAPPAQPAGAWPAPTTSRPRRTFLGIERTFWVAAFLPVAPMILFGLAMPGFIAPLLDERVRIVGLPPATLVLPLVPLNLILARINRTLGIVSVVLTSVVGFLWAMFGPAVVLILVNLGGATPG